MAPSLGERNGSGITLTAIKALRRTDYKLAKQLLKRLKKHKSKSRDNESKDGVKASLQNEVKQVKEENIDLEDNVEVQYVPAGLSELIEGDITGDFDDIVRVFSGKIKEEESREDMEMSAKLDFKEKEEGHSDDEDEEGDEGVPKLSKKQIKLMKRPTVSQLKQVARRPEVVDAWDTTAEEPYFLVLIKSLRNTVPVPVHWNQKRKYMQGKRGIEKLPFKLPSYIEATKISEIRQTLLEKESMKTLKQKQREKARPKSHRMDIDYQVLHDAFFKYATKPSLTAFGDIYYEGKENEMKMKQFKSGRLTDRAKLALGMTENSPPPWLINMQRYGPPPSFPSLKIPGLNCPIPRGCEYGYHPGGWGKPPVDEYGNPLYDGFRMDGIDTYAVQEEGFWGNLPSDSEEELEEDEEAEEEKSERGAPVDGTQTPATLAGGSETPLLEGMASVGATSVTSGLETPLSLDLRKRGFTSAGVKPYTVLPQREATLPAGSLFPSNISYKIPASRVGGGIPPLVGGAITPSMGGTATPSMGGMMTPTIGGMVTPFAGSSHMPISTSGMDYYAPPMGGMATPSGMITPNMGGVVTPLNALDGYRGGVQTPSSGVTVNLNPSEMEQEGVFTADVIRQQLKHHEEQSAKAQRAAGQIDAEEMRKRKTEAVPSAQEVVKKKKKKEFKF